MRHALARYVPDVVEGEVQGFFVEIVDVTSIKQSEQALQRAQEIGRLGSFVREWSSETWVATSMLEQIFGIGPDYEHSLEGWERLLHPDDRQAIAGYRNEVITSGGVFDREYRIIRPSDGAVRWMHGLRSLPSRNASCHR